MGIVGTGSRGQAAFGARHERVVEGVNGAILRTPPVSVQVQLEVPLLLIEENEVELGTAQSKVRGYRRGEAPS